MERLSSRSILSSTSLSLKPSCTHSVAAVNSNFIQTQFFYPELRIELHIVGAQRCTWVLRTAAARHFSALGGHLFIGMPGVAFQRFNHWYTVAYWKRNRCVKMSRLYLILIILILVVIRFEPNSNTTNHEFIIRFWEILVHYDCGLIYGWP